MQPSRRHPSGPPRAALRTIAAALAAAVLLGAATAGPALASSRPAHRSPASKSHPSPTSHRGWVKYFIVSPPKHGAKEFLFEIAADTLGKGSLSKEIFSLNKGRLQPGGGRLENPTVIQPGWILILPSDAHGPGVHFGPLPVVIPVPSPSPSASSSPRPAPVRHQHAVAPPARPGRRVVVAGVGGALIIVLLVAIGLLLMRRRRSGNKRHRPGARAGRRRGPGPRQRDRKARQADPGLPVPVPQSMVLASDPAPPVAEPALGGLAGEGLAAEPGPLDTPAYPSWLAPPPPEVVDAATEAVPPSPAGSAMPGTGLPDPDLPAPATPAPAMPRARDGVDGENVSWPGFLNLADSGPAAQGPVVPAPSASQLSLAGSPAVSTEPGVTDVPADLPPWLAHDDGAKAAGPPLAEHEPAPDHRRPETEPLDARQPEVAFSPVALRLLGAQRSAAQRAEAPVQRHEIGFGEDRIEIVLAQAPPASEDSNPPSGQGWLTDPSYLAWTPLPYEGPDGGTAFACLGVGDEGCLFIDLAAAPGAVAIGGDHDAAARLAESIVHQLGMSSSAGQPPCVVAVVGAAVPAPHPAAVLSLASLEDLPSVSGTGTSDAIEIVFSELRSDEDAFALARYVASNQRRVVPVVLADLPDAPWSFTAQPSLLPTGELDPASA